MDDLIILNFRNVLLLGAVLSTASLATPASPELYRMLLKLKSLAKAVRQSLKTCALKTASSRFWEVDMTKFEP